MSRSLTEKVNLLRILFFVLPLLKLCVTSFNTYPFRLFFTLWFYVDSFNMYVRFVMLEKGGTNYTECF